ncbi:MAG: bifunctional metallophosphatase/5'-nucleotidase, partial [Methanoregula sp.]|nr:bifunctional metallophosphatase/5'-nucleotidase [Methanoregula sp.]
MKTITGVCIIIVGILLISGLFVSGIFTKEQAPIPPVHVSILAINDFHGHLSAGQQLNNRSAGSAAILASDLKSAMHASNATFTILALVGDTIGASPRNTSLLMDEPTILFFNEFANSDCASGTDAKHSRCNVIAIPGNHEFNRGTGELLRMTYG